MKRPISHAPGTPMTLLAPPIGPSLRKIRNARAATVDAVAAWSAFQAAHPTTFNPVVADAGHSWAWVAHDVPKVIPPDVIRHLNSAVSEMRTALDALVYARGAQLGLSGKRLNNNSFPVVDHESAWEDRRNRQLAGIDEGFVERVRQVQPFVTKSRPSSQHPLTHLNLLSNRDKHRGGIWVVSTMTPGPGVSKLSDGISFDLKDQDEAAALAGVRLSARDVDRLTFFHTGPIEDGTVVSRVSGPTPKALVRPEAPPALSVPVGPAVVVSGIDDLAPLQYALPALANHAEAVVRFIAGERPSPPTPMMTHEALEIVERHIPLT